MPARPLIPVRYEQGLYLPSLDLWLDPHQPKPRAFVSHAHSDHFAPHAWTLCSEATRDLIGSRYGAPVDNSLLALPWQTLHTDHGHQLRILPAGHILGSAMLHVTRQEDGATLLYTGDFKLRQGLSAEKAELLEADTLILETTFGLPEFRFPSSEVVIAQVLAFVRETLEDGGIPVLLGYSLGKAQEILAALNEVNIPVMLHSSMVKLTQTYEKLQHRFPVWRPFKQNEAAGHVLIFPPSAARSLVIRKMKVCRTAMLSGWALTPGAKFRYQVDEVFPLSDHADYTELLECVEQVKPRMVYTVHGYTTEFARDLRSRGYEAWSLVDDNQLELLLPEAATDSTPASKLQLEAAAVVQEAPEPQIAPDAFARWAMTCERVSADSSRLKKQDELSDYLQQLPEKEVPRAVRWFSANLDDPSVELPPIQTGWATIKAALLSVSGLREKEYRSISRSQNDTGRTAFLVLGRRPVASTAYAAPTLDDLAKVFLELRQAKGQAAKIAVLKSALSRLSPLEGSYLVRLLTGELRIGSREGLVEEAVAKAFDQEAELIREAAMLTGDIGQAATLARRNALTEAQPSVFTPIKVMLASPEETAEDIWKRLTSAAESGGSVWLEDKFDGIRAQLHVSSGRVEIFSRDLNRITHQFPEIVTQAAAITGSAILDGEIIAFAENKKLTFHDLQRRLGRKTQGDLFIPSDITVKYVIFDILWRDGVSLLRESLEARRRHLDAIKLPKLLERIALLEANSPEETESAFHAARRNGNEGLIAKDRHSPYTPGRRGKTWLKLKKAFSTLDVVVVKAEQGHGKRSHVLSDYTFAVRDEASGELKVIGKAYSGLTDAEIEELTIHFTEHTLSQRGNVRTVTPNVVLEIAFDSIRASNRHDSGLALRFPRIKAIRQDKKPDEIDTLAYAKQLAGIHLPTTSEYQPL